MRVASQEFVIYFWTLLRYIDCPIKVVFTLIISSSSNGLLYLMQPADIYLIDEPSAYLDSEQRIVASKVIKRFILHAKKTAFVVEHDFIMATYLADRVIVYEGKPSIDCTANSPQSLLTGMNLFLSVSVTTLFAFLWDFRYIVVFNV